MGLHGAGGRAGGEAEGVQPVPGQPALDGLRARGRLHALPARAPRRGDDRRRHRRASLRRLPASGEPALRADGGADRRMSAILDQYWTQLLDVVHHLGPLEIVDIAVVTFLLYQVLRLLRGTQGTQIVVGLILLAVVGVVSTSLNLVLLSWLFRNATFFIIIAVIVMFQPELRRALDQLGRIGHIGR